MLQFNFTPFPVLSTKRLTLRQLQAADVNEVYKMRSDVRVWEHIDREPCKSIAEAEAFIEMVTQNIMSNESIMWAITLTGSDALIGTVAFWRMEKENYRGEIGYMLHPDHYGKDIMTEAVAAALDYGFTEMKLHSVEANTNPANIGSQRVLEKNGFVREGYFRENYYYKGKFLDSTVYSLITPYK